MRLISPSVQFGDQLEEVPAVLLEDVILLLDLFPTVGQVSRQPAGNYPRKSCDGAEDISDYFHDWGSFGVKKTSEESSVEIFLMDGDQIIQTGYSVQEIVLELQPGYL